MNFHPKNIKINGVQMIILLNGLKKDHKILNNKLKYVIIFDQKNKQIIIKKNNFLNKDCQKLK